MNLKTFLPPKPPDVAVAEPPAVGDPAPPLLGERLTGPAVVAFLRHTGCPFAEWTAGALRAAAKDDPDIEWIAVSHASVEATEHWAREIGGAEGVRLVVDAPPGSRELREGQAIRVVVDPERAAYAAWGLGRSSLSHFAGRRSLGQVARLARDGVRNRHPDGTRWQQAGTFAVASGDVIWRHLPEHAGDLPDLDATRLSLRAR